jgi:MHS family proline/betaine transporter-like MFS transporter
MMAAGTIAIGLVPSYASIGVAAPAILLVARIVQGLAAGGEWGTAAAFLAEWAGPNRRGLYGGMLLASVSAGLLLGSGVAALLSSTLAPEAFAAWGWRVPFLLGIVLVPMGLYLRRHVDDPPIFAATALPTAGRHVPAPAAVGALFVRAVCICMPLLIGSYMVTVYMPSFGQLQGHVDRSLALWSNTAALAVSVVSAPLLGALSDRVGRRRQLLAACVVLIVLPYPVFATIAGGTSFGAYLALQLLLTLAVVAFTGPAPACIAEIFPTRSRAAGASTANAVAGIVGGSSPFISTWLINASGIPASPALLIVASAIVAGVALVGLREMAHEPLS